MMKKSLFVLLMAIVLSIVLVACGGTETPPDAPPVGNGVFPLH